MSTVKWHPYPKEKPPKEGGYLITVYYDESKSFPFEPGDKWVTTDDFCVIDGALRFLSDPDVIAWAVLPEPYDPPDPWDTHPDAITCRKYMEGDPETVKELEIFDA